MAYTVGPRVQEEKGDGKKKTCTEAASKKLATDKEGKKHDGNEGASLIPKGGTRRGRPMSKWVGYQSLTGRSKKKPIAPTGKKSLEGG